MNRFLLALAAPSDGACRWKVNNSPLKESAANVSSQLMIFAMLALFLPCGGRYATNSEGKEYAGKLVRVSDEQNQRGRVHALHFVMPVIPKADDFLGVKETCHGRVLGWVRQEVVHAFIAYRD